MGTSGTKIENRIKKNNNNIKTALKAFNPTDPPPVLSERDALLLKDVWESLKDDIHRVGVITFIR